MREGIAETAISILGEKANVMYILETEDRKTKLKDGSATAGKNFFVRGAMLKVMGDDPSVGVTLTDDKGEVTKIDDDDIAINKPSELTLLLPASLADGEYTLTVTTQYSKGNVSLKSPEAPLPKFGSVANRPPEVAKRNARENCNYPQLLTHVRRHP